MKYYELKKDLPTFKAGSNFYLSDSGSLIYNGCDVGSVAYSKKTLEKFPNILKDWFEEIKEGARWRGEFGKEYWWFNDIYNTIQKETEDRDETDENRYRLGNYFKTEAEAVKYGEYLEALQTIKDDTKGFVPNWKDYCQLKYYTCYSYINNCFDCFSDGNIRIQGVVYFKSKKDIKESLEKHRKEWLIVLGVEE